MRGVDGGERWRGEVRIKGRACAPARLFRSFSTCQSSPASFPAPVGMVGRCVRAVAERACRRKRWTQKNTPPSFFCPVEKERLCVGGSVAANACVRLAGHQGGVLGLRHSVTGNACVSARWLAGASTRGRPFFLSSFEARGCVFFAPPIATLLSFVRAPHFARAHLPSRTHPHTYP